VLGGGAVGVELAQVVARLGGQVDLVEGRDRVLPREPAALDATFAELGRARGAHAGLDAAIAALRDDLAAATADEGQARRLAGALALALQAAVLVQAGQGAIAAAFVDARLGAARGLAYGTLRGDAPVALLLERAFAG
jgi:putative acyl-CoA dehydrogenase